MAQTTPRKLAKKDVRPGMVFRFTRTGDELYEQQALVHMQDSPGYTSRLALIQDGVLPKASMFITPENVYNPPRVTIPEGAEVRIVHAPNAYKPRQNLVTFIVRQDETDSIQLLRAFWSIFRRDTVCMDASVPWSV